jgi:Tfp pilus assembly protein PilP
LREILVSLLVRWLDKGVKWIGILLLVVPLLWLVLAQIDVPLNPQVKSWQQPEPEEVPPEQNAYYAIIGFYAAEPSADINQVGQNMLAQYLQRLRVEPNLEEFKYSQGRRTAGAPADLCDPVKAPCMRTTAHEPDRVAELERQNAILLQRYYSLYRYTHYRETAPAHYSGPLPKSVTPLHNLVLAKIAQTAAQGQRKEALEALARDTGFWRMVLHEGNRLLGKAIATRTLLENEHLLSEMLASAESAEEDGAVLESMLRPLDRQDNDLEPAIRYEYRIFASGWTTQFSAGLTEGLKKRSPVVRGAVRLLASAGLRPHQTTNLLWQQYEQLTQLDLASWTNESPPSGARKRRHFGDSPWDFVYNPIGKYFVYEVPPDVPAFSRYRARLDDLEGFIRLVTLQRQIKKDRINAEAIPALLAASDVSLRDPYTGEPMHWDAQRGVLWFNRRGMREGDRIALEVQIVEASSSSTGQGGAGEARPAPRVELRAQAAVGLELLRTLASVTPANLVAAFSGPRARIDIPAGTGTVEQWRENIVSRLDMSRVTRKGTDVIVATCRLPLSEPELLALPQDERATMNFGDLPVDQFFMLMGRILNREVRAPDGLPALRLVISMRGRPVSEILSTVDSALGLRTELTERELIVTERAAPRACESVGEESWKMPLGDPGTLARKLDKTLQEASQKRGDPCKRLAAFPDTRELHCQYLEYFPLGDLVVHGYVRLTARSAYQALVEAPGSSYLHRVRLGEGLGEQAGVVTHLADGELEITERVHTASPSSEQSHVMTRISLDTGRISSGPVAVASPGPMYRRDDLELYALEDLLVESVADVHGQWQATIMDAQGLRHVVHAEDYIGMNLGKITQITSGAVYLEEVVPDNAGGYVARKIVLEPENPARKPL